MNTRIWHKSGASFLIICLYGSCYFDPSVTMLPVDASLQMASDSPLNLCVGDSLDCDINAECANNMCVCSPGFLGDGITCRRPISCREIQETMPEKPSGPSTINPDGGGDLEVYCDMDSRGGGWTLIAVIANGDEQNWRPSSGNWENQTSFGLPDPFANSDYKSEAYFRVPGSELMFWYNGTYLFRTVQDSCLSNESLATKVSSFTDGTNGWECSFGGSLDPQDPVECAHECTLEDVIPTVEDLALTAGAQVTRLYIKAGERDGADDSNQDQVYISTEERQSIQVVMGLGTRCGGPCLGASGEADMSRFDDGIAPMGPDNVYSVFVR